MLIASYKVLGALESLGPSLFDFFFEKNHGKTSNGRSLVSVLGYFASPMARTFASP